jgi:SprT-like family.
MITQATLIAAYELLRTCPPFLGWRLPDPGEIEFVTIKDRHLYGDCDGEILRVSVNKHGHLNTLLATVAHEMVHLHQMRAKLETPNTEHNKDFRRRAARVCRIHGFDPKVF